MSNVFGMMALHISQQREEAVKFYDNMEQELAKKLFESIQDRCRAVDVKIHKKQVQFGYFGSHQDSYVFKHQGEVVGSFEIEPILSLMEEVVEIEKKYYEIVVPILEKLEIAKNLTNSLHINNKKNTKYKL